MLRLAFSTVRTRRALFLGSLASVILSLVLLTSAGILLESALRGHGEADRFAAADAVVVGDPAVGLDNRGHPAGFGDLDAALTPRPLVPESVVDRVRSVDGVASVVPDRVFYAQVVGTDGTAVTPREGDRSYGHAWDSARVTPFALRSGRAPTGAREVAVDAVTAERGGLRVGTEATVLDSVEGQARYRVSGIVAPPRAGLTKDQSALFFAPGTALRLAPDGGRLQAVAVFARPGTDTSALAARVRTAVGSSPSLSVLTDTYKAELSGSDVLFINTLVFVVSMGSLAVFVALFVMASGFAFAVLQRYREIALLRVVGATPRQVKRMIGWETLVVAVLGAAVAVPLGALAAGPLARGLVSIGVAPEELHVRVGPWPLAGSALAGLVITRLAVWSAARRAARVSPTEALRESEAPDRRMPWSRLLTGFAFLLFTGAFLAFGIGMGGVAGSGLAFGGALTLLVAAAALGPALVRPLVPLVGLLVRTTAPSTGRLALANSAASPRRVAAAAVPIILMVGFTASALLMQTTQQSVAASWAGERLAAAQVLLPQDAPGLPPAVAREAARLPGVAAVSATSTASVRASVRADDAESATQPALAADAHFGEVLKPHVREGDLRGLAAGTAVAVSQEQAKDYGWRVGDRMKLRLPDGTVTTLRIGARFDRSLGFADLIVPAAVLRAHTPDAVLDAVYLIAAPGAQLDGAVSKLTKRWPTVHGADRAAMRAAGAADAVTETWPVYLFSALIAVFTALALANALVTATLVRAGEFSVLRLIGATRRNVLALVAWESAVIAGCGVVLGGAVAFVVLSATSVALSGAIHISGPPGFVIAAAAGATALALVSALVPAWRMLRTGPASAA
ncbi:FtsX-like permease family protein [Streptomyces sp. NBC_01465]|uniref:FtsX-like permease family protein n=1 Tax=Streptomyces sp. NBC_01465 TaxID=2903878 RepID=UPI002E318814|nr:FtsX-like permease family protein [Streptomyces sp. NBC_01465]